MSQLKSLDDLATEKCPVLFDNSVISGYLNRSNGNHSIMTLGEKIKFKENCNNFLQEFVEKVSNGNEFFVTNLVWDEIGDFEKYNYKKNVRKQDSNGNKDLLKLRRLIEANRKSVRRVSNILQEQQKIISLDAGKKGYYDYLKDKYCHLESKYKLSPANFDFLLTGITLSQKSGPVILSSNDYNIFYARNEIAARSLLDKRMFRFFTRKEAFEFNQLVP